MCAPLYTLRCIDLKICLTKFEYSKSTFFTTCQLLFHLFIFLFKVLSRDSNLFASRFLFIYFPFLTSFLKALFLV